MSTILTIALLVVPVIATSAYLLRNNRNVSVILASEATLYVGLVLGYLQLAMTLVPASEPRWMQGIGFLSFVAVATGLAPVTAGRITRRLTAAETARQAKEHGE